MKVRRISAEDTYPIRRQVLYPDRPFFNCAYPGDDDDLTFHLGAFENNKLVSVASFYFNSNPYINVPNQFQLRGMATVQEHQHTGISTILLHTAIPLIKQNQCNVLWLNARMQAKSFYENFGFTSLGEPFDIENIPHILMDIRLDDF